MTLSLSKLTTSCIYTQAHSLFVPSLTLSALSSPTSPSMEMEEAMKSKWSNLPKDILLQILRHLNFTTDLPRLRAVCPEWRSAVPLSLLADLTSLNLALNPPPLPQATQKPLPLLLLHTRFLLLSPIPSSSASSAAGPLGGRWVARMSETGPTNKWHFLNPLNILDYIHTHPPLTASLNLLDCRTLQLAAPFTLVGGGADNAKAISKKVVGGWDFDSGHLFSVLVQLDRYGTGGGLLSWKLGDTEWTYIQRTHPNENDNEQLFRVLDIASHGGSFYVFELAGWRVGVMDPSCPSKPMEFFPAPDILGDTVDDRYTVIFRDRSCVLGGCHFVAANCLLYLVIEAIIRPDDNANADEKEKKKKKQKNIVIVYVLKQEDDEKGGMKSSWEHVDSLGDQIFFIGYDVAFSLPAASVNLPQWKPGSICLFTRPFPMLFDGYVKGYGPKFPKGAECLDSINYASYWRYFRVFEGEDEGVVSFEELSKEVYTGLFFPPPAWVQWRCPSLGNAEVELAGLKFREDNCYASEPDDESDDE